MQREKTDPVEQAHDIRLIAVDVMNIAIQQSGSDPLNSLHEGDSKLNHILREFGRNINTGPLEKAKLRKLRQDLMHASALTLRMVVMIETELDRP